MSRTRKTLPTPDPLLGQRLFCHLLRAMRKKRGWSQGDVRGWTGGEASTQGRISTIEKGTAGVSEDVQIRIAAAFGLTLRAFYEEALALTGSSPARPSRPRRRKLRRPRRASWRSAAREAGEKIDAPVSIAPCENIGSDR